MGRGFKDFSTATTLRSVVKQWSTEVVDAIRPRYRYATVQSVDLSTRQAFILYEGDTDPVEVSFGTIAVPEGLGQIVRIEGFVGDRYVSDVLTPYVP